MARRRTAEASERRETDRGDLEAREDPEIREDLVVRGAKGAREGSGAATGAGLAASAELEELEVGDRRGTTGLGAR